MFCSELSPSMLNSRIPFLTSNVQYFIRSKKWMDSLISLNVSPRFIRNSTPVGSSCQVVVLFPVISANAK